jgi:hypothetical protein
LLTRWYSCSDLNIQRCNLDGSNCLQVEYCAEGCFDTGHGALCVDRGLDSRGESNIGSVSSAQSKCDGVAGKCRECTETRRGVYTCSSGFCAVKPGDWCKAGWSCQDDCDCCKKYRKRGVQALERSTDDVKVSSLHGREPVDPVKVLETYGSCPNDFHGHQSCRENNSVIVVCDPADSLWRSIGKCVGGDHCCEARRDNPDACQCKC